MTPREALERIAAKHRRVDERGMPRCAECHHMWTPGGGCPTAQILADVQPEQGVTLNPAEAALARRILLAYSPGPLRPTPPDVLALAERLGGGA